MSRMSGRCLCGAVTFSVEKVETAYHACHCGMCRRWAGGPFFAAEAEGLRIEGRENVAVYDSSKWAERAFCTRCGTNLYYRLKPTDGYYVSVGAFDDPTPFRLAEEFYVDAKPPGYDFAGAHPRLTQADVIAKFAPRDASTY